MYTPLSPIFIRLILHLLDLNLHPILGKDEMLALQLLARVLAHILDDGVDDVADGGEDGDEEEEEDEEEDAVLCHCGGRSVVVVGLLSNVVRCRGLKVGCVSRQRAVGVWVSLQAWLSGQGYRLVKGQRERKGEEVKYEKNPDVSGGSLS